MPVEEALLARDTPHLLLEEDARTPRALIQLAQLTLCRSVALVAVVQRPEERRAPGVGVEPPTVVVTQLPRQPLILALLGMDLLGRVLGHRRQPPVVLGQVAQPRRARREGELELALALLSVAALDLAG